MVELSSKFGADPGEAVDLIEAAFEAGLVVEGLSFHVGSQSTNFENYVQALNMAAGGAARRPRAAAAAIKLLDIGGGFPAPYDPHVQPFSELARTHQRRDSTGCSRRTSRFWPSRAGSWWPPPATRVARSSARPSATARRCYYLDDGVYHTFSGIIFDHCQYHLKAFKKGPTRDLRGVRPDLRRAGHDLAGRGTAGAGDRATCVYRENIGAYSNASSTWFNGFPPAKVVHVNE